MFLEFVVEDEVVAEGAEEQVEGERPEVGDDEEAEELAAGLALGPAGRVDVGCEEVAVGGVQDQVHGVCCRKETAVWAVAEGVPCGPGAALGPGPKRARRGTGCPWALGSLVCEVYLVGV